MCCRGGSYCAVEEVDDVADAVLGHVEACGEDVVLAHGGDGERVVARGAQRRVAEADEGEVEIVPREVLGAHEAMRGEKLDGRARDEDEVLSFGHSGKS